ncbi:MAG TPA: hypothetical protein PKJ17_06495 [Syntrophorhabdaceae bacterium]|nr:hypothetical protein [Syntrophorhabdaceae bacterium]
MKRFIAVMIGMALVCAGLGSAFAAGYSFNALDYPGASETRAYGINDWGVVVGSHQGAGEVYGHAFVLRGDTWTSFDDPDAAFGTSPRGINDWGKIAGTFGNSIGDVSGFTLAFGVRRRLDYPTAAHTFLGGVNGLGTVVGYYMIPSTRSFVLKGTTYTLLDYPPTTDDPENPTGWLRAHDINDHGVIVGGCTDANGSHGCYSSGGAWVLLDYPDATSTEAFGVNNHGIIVGQYTGEDGSVHGFSYDGTIWNTLDHPGATSTIAYGINDRGTIVGTFEDANGTHGFLAKAVSDLTSLAIDIRPWSAENVLHLLERGLLPVAVLGGNAFDALGTIDLGTISFGRTGDEDSMAFCSPWDWDVNADGYQDLICLFWVQKAGFQCGDTGGILKGMTQDGTTLEGRDAVKVIPCR